MIPPKSGWRKRWEHLADLAGATTTCALRQMQDGEGGQPSLGLVKVEVRDLLVEANDAFADDKAELARLAAAENLLQEAKSVLEPAPFRLTYLYRCVDEPRCNGHKQTLIDWEAGEAARRWIRAGYPREELPNLLRAKFLNEMCGRDRDTHFFVGNQFMHHSAFLVLGVFWPPAGSRPERGLF